MTKKRIVSGMRPTGRMHLGHLHGALLNWKMLQKDYECFYFIADWHALTSDYAKPEIIGNSSYGIVMDWISVGIDPEVATIFVQSSIKEHAELHLIFSMITPLAWLERNPTYKEQLKEITQKDIHTYGFLGYPVLQAADILMYMANGVPVGEDQAPHVELTREIARRFNFLYGPTFPEPDVLLVKETSKLLGIDNRKMSKSYDNAIFLTDTDEVIRSKVSQMITDPQRMRKSDPGNPDVCNVYSFHEIYTDPADVAEIDAACRSASVGCVECKRRMAANLIKGLGPVREKRMELEADRETIRNIVERGNEKARLIASETMRRVREAVKI
ncbi:MAG: tryptophan--tRNA ligase [Deltaproteobacteria bacterium CG_4_8_14_3_um_filter_51_11]|nr:tryptophan--tRNA ligase [bacterium]OIP40329.1 MAG: tryptophan--tRNA ligase [Desulfobacteraceae bacterium CG2_30_51_40]PIP47816.1 MAG: tryptophan--tRNA ligase [Deltaproteobacteria bacterium CG23_combo_of_CG06-09_8_20_14_all_51_20]PIX20364.1 MAG: tryptophan--tRNA ligase [Deltaproteobacteria bacterium CG_4_8_14_3_um_filter_51_11]PIY24555.1 MAG: tryptophan--tRNA ligase [Deltaproteobacteria bacterium CG_4_10_14_3_um_filter_51_14]PJB38613.1 MAG: tryptophan--tRNA ligase [Deltaproteobacteria bacter